MKRLLSLFLVFLVAAAEAAVTAVSTGSWQFQGLGGTTLTFAHTITTENLLVVYTQVWTDVSGVTFNGAALSKASGVDDFSTTYDLDAWYLLNPSVGTFNIVVTRVGTSANTNAVAVSFSGVDARFPLGTAATATAANCSSASAYQSVDVATAAGDYVFGEMASGAATGTTVVGEAGTGQASLTSKHSSGLENLAASRIIATGPSTTFRWQCSSSAASAGLGFSIKAPATATAPAFPSPWEGRSRWYRP